MAGVPTLATAPCFLGAARTDRKASPVVAGAPLAPASAPTPATSQGRVPT